MEKFKIYYSEGFYWGVYTKDSGVDFLALGHTKKEVFNLLLNLAKRIKKIKCTCIK